MNDRINKFILYFTFFYVAAFSINALIRGNVEFIYYTAVMVLSIIIVLLIHKRFHFYPIILLSLSLLGLLHLMGGNVYLGEIRLYDYYFIPYFFKYDNFVHMVGSGIMVMLAYELIVPVVNHRFEQQQLYFVILLVLIGMGLGAINELLEFLAVILFDVGQWVGDYTNTLLDLTFNTIGSLAMAVMMVKTKLALYGKS